MNNIKVLTQYSPWFILLCIAIGAGYAFALYSKKAAWGQRINYLLALLRFVLVSILCFLLIGPLVKYFKNFTEKPTIVLAIDNSQSVSLTEDSTKLTSLKKSIADLRKKLEETSIAVEERTLDGITKNEVISFNSPTTPLASMLETIQSDYENRNLAGTVLISDGIYNQGSSPTFKPYRFPVHTVGIGDTVARMDISLKNVLYNTLSYRDHKFPIVAEVQQQGFENKSTEIVLKQGTTVLDTKTMYFRRNGEIQRIEFTTSSSQPGMQHYTLEIKALKGEFTLRNNAAHVYVDVLENKEKILCIATAPHPDIKALRAAIEKKEHYEFYLHIPGVTEYKEDAYDLVILHQLPDYSGTAKAIIDKQIQANRPIWYIVGAQTNLNQLNNTNKILQLNSRQGQKDLVTPSYNGSFERFGTPDAEQKLIQNFPPITVPYGDYNLKENADVLLSQKIGSTASSRPLLLISADRKQAILAGEGIWQWRQHEYMETQAYTAFDNLVTNMVQFLSSTEDKRKFRVFPISREFSVADPVLFETEVYNDVFEKIYGQTIELKISDENGESTSYSFANGENNSRFEVKGLSQGLYRYTATTKIGNKVEKSEGKFTIKELELEALSTTADHEMLRILAAKNNGAFVKAQHISSLAEKIISSDPKTILHTNEELIDLISFPWLFFILLALLSTEWFMRKYKGGY